MNRAFRRLTTLLLTVTGSAVVTGCTTVEEECPDTKYWNPQKRVLECGSARYTTPATMPPPAMATAPARMPAPVATAPSAY